MRDVSGRRQKAAEHNDAGKKQAHKPFEPSRLGERWFERLRGPVGRQRREHKIEVEMLLIKRTERADVLDYTWSPSVTCRPAPVATMADDAATATAVLVKLPHRLRLPRTLQAELLALAHDPATASRRLSRRELARRLETVQSRLRRHSRHLLAATLERVEPGAPPLCAVVLVAVPLTTTEMTVVSGL